MNPARSKGLALCVAFAVVLGAAIPVFAAPSTSVNLIEKTGASGQRYLWLPGGC
ncbi:MAG: hypothetical protein QNJ98_17275 [Planctomycetota bacterium]|nr:hypothetical protein [Planctomycetota bacterium]